MIAVLVVDTFAPASDQNNDGDASPSSAADSSMMDEMTWRQTRTRNLFQLVTKNDKLQLAVFWFLPEEARSMQAFAWMLSQEEHHNDGVLLMESMMEVRVVRSTLASTTLQ